MPIPAEFKNVTAIAKANVYFDAKVVSHTILFPDGSKKTLGLIYPGKYHFGTDKAERMEIIAGNFRVVISGHPGDKTTPPVNSSTSPPNPASTSKSKTASANTFAPSSAKRAPFKPR